MRNKTADFKTRQNSRFSKRYKTADFQNGTKQPIFKTEQNIAPAFRAYVNIADNVIIIILLTANLILRQNRRIFLLLPIGNFVLF